LPQAAAAVAFRDFAATGGDSSSPLFLLSPIDNHPVFLGCLDTPSTAPNPTDFFLAVSNGVFPDQLKLFDPSVYAPF
jgi:hypothetical protein